MRVAPIIQRRFAPTGFLASAGEPGTDRSRIMWQWSYNTDHVAPIEEKRVMPEHESAMPEHWRENGRPNCAKLREYNEAPDDMSEASLFR